jgi:hypothetical protein
MSKKAYHIRIVFSILEERVDLSDVIWGVEVVLQIAYLVTAITVTVSV